jgi:hypothetical protein
MSVNWTMVALCALYYFAGMLGYRAIYTGARLRQLKRLYSDVFDKLFTLGASPFDPELLKFCSDEQVLATYRQSSQASPQFRVAENLMRERKLRLPPPGPPYRNPSK